MRTLVRIVIEMNGRIQNRPALFAVSFDVGGYNFVRGRLELMRTCKLGSLVMNPDLLGNEHVCDSLGVHNTI